MPAPSVARAAEVELPALGRSVVVAPGAPAPTGWTSCERVRVAAVDAEIADELGAAWRERRSLVVELVPGLGLDDPTTPPAEVVVGRQPWEWSVGLDLVGERLHHAVWANAVDARGGTGRHRWQWAEVALRLGASEAPGAGLFAGRGGADVVLPDGRPAICDGGPLDGGLGARFEMAVVHRISLEHGALAPLGPSDLRGVALAPDQLAAVAEAGAGARVIAPAGSGKTRVLTERARLLLDGWGVPARAVALVAFNVRAAEEMRTRLAGVGGTRVRTLNSLGLRLCGRSTTIDEGEVRRHLAKLVTMPRRAESDPAAPWIAALSRVRLGLGEPASVEAELPDVSGLEAVARAYRDELAARGEVDFDEQVTAAIERLLGDASFRSRSQRFARVLLVDEFQDLTPAHMLLIRLLTGPAGAVFGVGDDDQTIYGYAGATPRWLVDFDRWFPGTATHSLEVNYRCPAPVVAAASNLLTRNVVRVDKRIRPAPVDPAALGDVEPLVVVAGDAGPAARSAQRVHELLDSGARPGELAVLARVNASLAPVQVLLRHRGIAVEGGVDGRFLQRGGVRAALAWLDVAAAPDRALPGALLREAARRPKRAMSASLLDLVAKQGSAESLASLAGWLEAKRSEREATKVRDLASDVALVRRAAKDGTTSTVLALVRHRIGEGGLDASATALDAWSQGAIAAHGDDLDALDELADLEPDPALFSSWLDDQLRARGPEGQADAVTLSSIHAVKGREWPHVVLHHVTEGLLPHRLADDVEEERRVFHVGLTRCRASVSVVPGEPPSSFLAELFAPRGSGERSSAAGRGERRADEPGSTGTTAAARRARSGRAGRPGQTARPGAGDAEPLSVRRGDRFTHAGHDYEVVEVVDDGARSVVRGGRAEMLVRFGTTVTAEGRPVLLAHPGAGEAVERLRAWRAGTATRAGKPAYVVFDDSTLRQLAAILPTSEAGLLAVRGIGQVKLDAYGDELIAIAESLRRR